MAYSYVYLESAQEERERIVDYLLSVADGPSAAGHFLDELDKRVALIRENPQMYPLSQMAELADRGYRTASFMSYIMLYTVSHDSILIEHIFSQRQDYAALV